MNSSSKQLSAAGKLALRLRSSPIPVLCFNPGVKNVAYQLLDGQLRTKADTCAVAVKDVPPQFFMQLRIKTRSRLTCRKNWWFSKVIVELRTNKHAECYTFDGELIVGRLKPNQQYKIRLTEAGLAHFSKRKREDAESAARARVTEAADMLKADLGVLEVIISQL